MDGKETPVFPGSLFTTGEKEQHGTPHMILESEETIFILFFNSRAVQVQLNVFSSATSSAQKAHTMQKTLTLKMMPKWFWLALVQEKKFPKQYYPHFAAFVGCRANPAFSRGMSMEYFIKALFVSNSIIPFQRKCFAIYRSGYRGIEFTSHFYYL